MKSCAALLVFVLAAAGFAATLEDRVPAGSTAAATVELRTIVNSPLFAKVEKKLPKAMATAGSFEAQFPIPRDRWVRLVSFGTADNVPGAFLEVAGFTAGDLDRRVGREPYRLAKSSDAGRSSYLVTFSAPHSGTVTVCLTFVADNVLLIAENPAAAAKLLALPAASAAEKEKLFGANAPEHIFYATSSSDQMTEAKITGSAPAQFANLATNAESITAALKFRGPNRGGLDLKILMPFKDEEKANQFIMSMNFIVILGIGMASSEDPALAQQIMQAIKLVPNGREATLAVTMNEKLTDQLLDLVARQLGSIVVPPEPSEIIVTAPAAGR